MLDNHHMSQKRPGVCAGCDKPILDRFYLLAVDALWHSQCLKCAHCSQNLDKDGSCFEKEGNIYCRDDYYRLFHYRCARCGNVIGKEDFVMKAKEYIYHIECFFCQFCENPLIAGDTAVVLDGKVFCATHGDQSFLEQQYPSLLQCSNTTPPRGRQRKRKYNLQNTENSELRKEMNYNYGMIDNSPGSLSLYFDDGQSPRSTDSLSAASRAKRVRTSFKHHQLRTMKSYFSINQNPDAKDLKQLAQKTGLSKRVLQVWFQNARAKFRRNVVRHEGNQKSTSNSFPFLPNTAPIVENRSEIVNDEDQNASNQSISSQFNRIY